MNKLRLIGFFDECMAAEQTVVLGLVTAASGSTYSKPGNCMLIAGDGRYFGMLSGGCLEGDLALHAARVLKNGRAERVVYDLANDDELWGLGVGCEGCIEVLLLPLDSEGEPFTAMKAVFEGRTGAWLRLRSGSAADDAADVSISGDDGSTLYGSRPDGAGMPGSGDARPLDLRLDPAPNILLLGAGPDVVPVLRMADEIGWRTTVADHRPAYLDSTLLDVAASRRLVKPAAINADLDLAEFDVAIVMSHHLDSDRAYLRALASSPIGRIELLGPASRRARLLGDLEDIADSLHGRLHGPAGLDLGGRGAGAIALSIVAGIQRYLTARDAGPAAAPASS